MAAAAIVAPTVISSPFPMSRPPNSSKVPPQPPATSRTQSSTSSNQPESSAGGFGRLRTSIGQSFRTATRSRKHAAQPSTDDFATITPKTSKGKEKAKDAPTPEDGHKERPKMLRRLESKVTFRRGGRESITPAQSPIPPSPVPPDPSPTKSRRVGGNDVEEKVRMAGFTSFVTPSLRQASMSSPALHLSSQALPSPRSQPAVAASSSTPTGALVSPTRERTRRVSLQPTSKDISAPLPHTSKREHESRSSAAANAPASPSRHHKVSKSTPNALMMTSSTTSLHHQRPHPSEPPDTPPGREPLSPPDTPTPMARAPSRSGAKGSTYLTNSTSAPPSPPTPRATSPLHARSSSRTRVVPPASPRLNSPSAAHLSPSPTLTARRPSLDAQRPSLIHAGSSSNSRGPSPSPVRPRPTSPNQRTYSQNRQFNISTTSLNGPSSPEHAEAVRTAAALLCRELARPPVRQPQSDNALKDWKEVEVRMQALARLERILGKSGGSGMASSGSISSGAPLSSTGFSASGEERLRRLFCEALRDGYVLCQLINKLRASSVVKPDPKEDGFVRTANVTKFLAACASYGLPAEDLFQRDDLIEASSESLARVARTIIALVKFADDPAAADRSRFLMMNKNRKVTPTSSGPYGHRSAAASTPNLNIAQRAASPTGIGLGMPSSPTRTKRFNPSPALPPVRSNSPDESQDSGESTNGAVSATTAKDALDARRSRSRDGTPSPLPGIGRSISGGHNGYLPPPPRSPLRPMRSPSRRTFDEDDGHHPGGMRASVADSTRASVGDYSVADRESMFSAGTNMGTNTRQSLATSVLSDSTMQSEYSSLMDTGLRGYGYGHGGGRSGSAAGRPPSHGSTPSVGRADGSAIAGAMGTSDSEKGKGGGPRERKVSGVAQVVDLSRVAEEAEESGSSSRGGGVRKTKERGGERSRGGSDEKEVERVEKPHAVRLGKGKWPDDFLDALQAHNNSARSIPGRSLQDDDDFGTHSQPATPLSVSPPRKLAIIGGSRRNESVESLPQFPRRPTHRARHSIDAPGLLPKESTGLLPKESVFRRDASPDGLAPSGRLMLRRHSTKQGLPPRSGSSAGVYMPRGMDERGGSSGDSGDALVPFPRTVSGEHGSSPSPRQSSGEDQLAGVGDKPRPLRGRFQSDVQGETARRRARPSSYDEMGAKPGAARSRFESMVNLGVASNTTSASDLMARDSMDGSGVRKALVIREEGKPPTHFQLGNCIGRGQFGSVYRALNLNTGQMVAVKRIRLEGLKEDEVTQLMREVDLVKSLSHPSIVKYEGMARDEDTLSIVLEYAESGSLVQTLKAFGKLNESLVAGYIVKILEGLHYLHQSDVVHCDLKAANILTTKTGNVKLADFGVSLNLRAMEREIKDVAGTPNWMAPEVIELKGASTKSDIWSLGCVAIELLTGRPPYAEIANSMSVMFRIVEDDTPPIPEGISSLCQDFLSRCFNKDPTLRPDAETLCEHRWLKHNWGAFKELRPQDSIPFLRRVSQDLAHKSDAMRYLANLDIPETPPADHGPRTDDLVAPSPAINRRTSHSSVRPAAPQDNELSLREHNFVKTSFSKPVVCRVCLLNVKKSAVLCAQCSLIAHSKCTPNAPPTCDLRATLLAMAEYADKGHPSSEYSNPIEYANPGYQAGPASDVSYIAHSPRTSLDIATPSVSPPNSSQGPNPPTAFKFMAAFKRSRSSLTPEPGQHSPSSPTSLTIPGEDRLRRGKSLARPKERPQSLSSTSTPNTSSLRSAATAAESFSSRHSRPELGKRSALSAEDREDVDTRASASQYSGVGEDGYRISKTTSHSNGSRADQDGMLLPGEMPPDRPRFRRQSHSRDSKSSNNCAIQ
ncbi:hypothetical protein HGRIS_004958 [Hohenbuehelia grisea]|uniref:non-specific serine/threonine protein kinase n=1 Tax=Hohenbuehelia grisea TaxID=104357 RepID=A0ABR3JDJ7_9AGAR